MWLLAEQRVPIWAHPGVLELELFLPGVPKLRLSPIRVGHEIEPRRTRISFDELGGVPIRLKITGIVACRELLETRDGLYPDLCARIETRELFGEEKLESLRLPKAGLAELFRVGRTERMELRAPLTSHSLTSLYLPHHESTHTAAIRIPGPGRYRFRLQYGSIATTGTGELWLDRSVDFEWREGDARVVEIDLEPMRKELEERRRRYLALPTPK